MKSKAERLITSSITNGAVFIIKVLVALLMTPLMVSSFGESMYGLWVLVGSFSGFYGLIDIGLLRAVGRYMSRAIGQDDLEEVKYVFNTSLAVFSFLGFCVFILACLFTYFAPYFIKGAQAYDVDLLRAVIILFSINVVIGFPMRSFWGVLSSNLRYDVSAGLDLFNVLLKAVAFFVFLKLGYGVLVIAIVACVADLIWNFLNVAYVFKIAPYLVVSRSYFDPSRIKVFFNYSIYAFISKIAASIKFNLDNFVISMFVGLSPIAVYSIGTRLVMYAADFLVKLIGLMGPVFSQYEGKGDFESIKKYFFFTLKIAIYLSFLFGTMLIIFGSPFILRWVGAQFKDSYKIILVLVFPVVMQMLMDPAQGLLYGISKHKILTFVYFGEACANLVLSLIFVRYWGIVGVALGTAIPLFLIKFFFEPFYVSCVLKISVRSFYALMFENMLKAGLVLFLLSRLIVPFVQPVFTRIILSAIILSISYLLTVVFIGFSKDERALVLRTIKR